MTCNASFACIASRGPLAKASFACLASYGMEYMNISTSNISTDSTNGTIGTISTYQSVVTCIAYNAWQVLMNGSMH